MAVVTQEMVDDVRANLIADESTWPENLPEQFRTELRLRRALQDYILELLEQNIGKENPEMGSWQDLSTGLDKIAKEQAGIEYGLPMPSKFDMKRPLITARNVPIHTYETELAEELASRITVRNSWHVLGDMSVAIVNTEAGPMAMTKYFAGNRLRKTMDGALLRTGMPIDADTELRAMESLKPRLTKGQWDSYVLSGVFPEYSKRSDLHYFFRKGNPTLVLSYHGDRDGGRVIAALCLHPVGYYARSHVGLMTPTDEVICALLMLRGDERKYWASCGQWSVIDPRSGI